MPNPRPAWAIDVIDAGPGTPPEIGVLIMGGTTVKEVVDKNGIAHLIHYAARIYAAEAANHSIWVCSAYDRFGRLAEDKTWVAETINKQKWYPFREFRENARRIIISGNLLPLNSDGGFQVSDHELGSTVSEAGFREAIQWAGDRARRE